jgi:hypothetical protein
MAKFLLSAHVVEGGGRPPMSEEEMRRSREQLTALEEELKASGALVASGRLDEPAKAAVVRVSNGKVMKTDGPFAETKEQLGGFYIIEAQDLDEALEWASRVTQAIHTPIETREFTGFAN